MLTANPWKCRKGSGYRIAGTGTCGYDFHNKKMVGLGQTGKSTISPQR